MGKEAATTTQKGATHVVLLASPGTGHILPSAELARRIVATHGDGDDDAGLTATLVTYTNFSSADLYSTLASLPPSVSTAVLPEVPLDDLPADARLETRIFTVVKRALPQLRDLLRSLLESPSGVSAFVSDLLSPWALQVAVELGIPRYVFSTTNLMALSCILHVPELDRTTTCEFRDLPEPVHLPGCVPLRGADLVDPIQNRSDPVYPLMVELGEKHHRLCQGFIVNTFDAIEQETLVAFKALSDKGVYPPAYAVGPFVRPCSGSGGEADDKHGCVRWLDEQPDASVVYVCLGSGGTLSNKQTAELAAGLEASGQRFLMVVRFPSDKDCSANFFGAPEHGDDPLRYLPDGFLERTSGVGLCVPLWAPQVEILNHRAVGGFLSHCGWNSTLEAVAAGVPTLAWPLYAEQRMNAVMLSERAGLALRPSIRDDDGIVPREEVAAVVRELIAGEKGAAAREKAREVQRTAAKAWAPDGPSRRAFMAVVAKWKEPELPILD